MSGAELQPADTRDVHAREALGRAVVAVSEIRWSLGLVAQSPEQKRVNPQGTPASHLDSAERCLVEALEAVRAAKEATS